MAAQRRLTMTVQARFALDGWRVKPYAEPNGQQYYLQKEVTVTLPDHGINEGKTYTRPLRERDGGWVGVGWNSFAQFIRTFRPDDLVVVELNLEDAAALVERMKEVSPPCRS